MAGVAVIAYRMLPGVDQDVVLDLMAIAGLAGLIVALVVGRQLIKASRAISLAVQSVGDSGVYIAPQRTLLTITRIERPASAFRVMTPTVPMTSADTAVQNEMKPRSEVAMPAGRLQASTPWLAVTPPPARTGIRRPTR